MGIPIPPELLMQGMQEGGPPPPPDQGMFPPGPPGAGPPQGMPAPQDPGEILRAMLDMAQAYRSVEEDQEDLLAIEQVTTLVQRLLAKEQKQHDDLIQGKASPQAMRRFAASG